MKFVGVDLHKQTITFAVVDAARTLLQRRRFSNLQASEMAAFLAVLGDFEITVEARASYEWFVRLVEPLARRVVLAHPGKLRIIAESTRKSDNLDARVLAEMLACDQILSAHAAATGASPAGATAGLLAAANHVGPQQGAAHPVRLQPGP